jgi:2-iminobutanoate/2-iminopropanoate deaminase
MIIFFPSLAEVNNKEFPVKAIHTDKAPKAIGTYSQAVQTHNDWFFLSGQIGLDPQSMALVGSDFTSQFHQIFKNIRAVLNEAGLNLSNIVKLTIFIINSEDYPSVNELMKEYFQEPYPARSTIGVSFLPKNSVVEVEALATRSN